MRNQGASSRRRHLKAKKLEIRIVGSLRPFRLTLNTISQGTAPPPTSNSSQDVVADDDRERVLNFLLNSSQDGSLGPT